VTSLSVKTAEQERCLERKAGERRGQHVIFRADSPRRNIQPGQVQPAVGAEVVAGDVFVLTGRAVHQAPSGSLDAAVLLTQSWREIHRILEKLVGQELDDVVRG